MLAKSAVQAIKATSVLGKGVDLMGWGTEPSTGVVAIYASLIVPTPSCQDFREPINGMALYIPDSGMTLATLPDNQREEFHNALAPLTFIPPARAPIGHGWLNRVSFLG